MPLSPEQARAIAGYKFSDRRIKYNKRDVILYAVGIGATDPRWVFEDHMDFAPFPTYPLVLGLKGESFDIVPFGLQSILIPPGFEEVDLSGILHGEQYIEMCGKLPEEGAELVNRSRVVSLEDKQKGALLRVETELVDEKTNTVLSRHRKGFISFAWLTAAFDHRIDVLGAGVFIKGMGNFGGDRGTPFVPTKLPDRPADRSVDLPTSESQATVYRLSGDYNNLHIDPEFAKMVGFEKPILHGLCTFAFAARGVIQELCNNDPELLRSLEGRFAAPVFPGEVLKVDMWNISPEEVQIVVTAKERQVVVLSETKAKISLAKSKL